MATLKLGTELAGLGAVHIFVTFLLVVTIQTMLVLEMSDHSTLYHRLSPQSQDKTIH
jgi:thiosulfate reductase cytochrome b subunit